MNHTESIVLGGGCFWCLDAAFQMLKGVTKVESGYAGGKERPPVFVGDVDSPDSFTREPNQPTYRQVSTGRTGHAEVVRVEFDPDTLSLADLLDFFFALHDPTTKDRQGPDVGSQYRSIILYASPAQERAVRAAIRRAQVNWDDPIVTEVRPLEAFHLAEEQYQDFFAKRPTWPYCEAVISPKLAKLRAAYADRLK